MTREIKAQREAREEGERLDRCMEYRSKYPERLMDALGRSTMLGWDISVVDGKFCVYTDFVCFDGIPYAIDLVNCNHKFEELVRVIGIAEDKLKEEERMERIRKAALEKLSSEEREALGL
jgi:hypothetical protein